MDFTSLYHTRILTNFDDDQEAILKSLLASIKSKDGSKVTLTNYYRGLPITYPATIVGVEHGNVDLDVNPQQAIAIASDHYTLLRSNSLQYPVVAHVQYVNVRKSAVSLNKLGYVDVLAEQRAAVRLDLDPPVRATILHDGREIAGQLVNISTQGLAMTVEEYTSMEKGTETTIRFMLPDNVLMKQTLIKLSAEFVAVSEEGSPYRYRFKISPEKHHEQLISRYGFQRQVEIIKVLKDAGE